MPGPSTVLCSLGGLGGTEGEESHHSNSEVWPAIYCFWDLILWWSRRELTIPPAVHWAEPGPEAVSEDPMHFPHSMPYSLAPPNPSQEWSCSSSHCPVALARHTLSTSSNLFASPSFLPGLSPPYQAPLFPSTWGLLRVPQPRNPFSPFCSFLLAPSPPGSLLGLTHYSEGLQSVV